VRCFSPLFTHTDKFFQTTSGHYQVRSPWSYHQS